MKAHPTREWRPPSVYQHRRWSSLGGDGVAVARTTVIGIRVEGFSGDGIVFFNTTHTTVRQLSLNRQRGYGITSFVGHDTRFIGNLDVGDHEAGFYVGDSPHADVRLMKPRHRQRAVRIPAPGFVVRGRHRQRRPRQLRRPRRRLRPGPGPLLARAP